MAYNNRTAFVMCRYPLGISSMIVNSIKMFAQKGISVDVFIGKKSFDECPISFTDSRICIYIFEDKDFGFLLRAYRFIMRNMSNLLYPFIKQCSFKSSLMITFPEVYRFSRWLMRIIEFDSYDYVVPVDCYSLLTLYDKPDKKKLVYYNMELLDWRPTNAVYGNKLILKELEYRLIQSLQCIILPSPARAESFCKLNKFPPEKIQILPVAAMGAPILKRSRYFREKFSIPDDHIIVLYSGNFVSWFQCIEMIDAMKTCRERYAFVMHTWNQNSTESGYFKEMIKHASGLPIFFSSEYIDYENLTEALSSADIGLAFYESMDDNCIEILHSSNKIGEYLKAGLAVITSDFKPLHDFVHGHKIGLAVPVQDIATAVEEIADQLDQYKSNAVTCYHLHYRFERYFENLYQFLYMR